MSKRSHAEDGERCMYASEDVIEEAREEVGNRDAPKSKTNL